jgi:hypothetical protein
MAIPPTHVPQIHRVRIFVVPDRALQGEPPPLGKKNRVTPRHLALADAHVKKEAPDLTDDGKAVIVIGDKAATFRDRKLEDHDLAIRHAAIRMFTESDVIEWESDAPFSIESTAKAENPIWHRDGTPDNPFHTGPPFDSAPHDNGRHKARSSTTTKDANGQQYKVSIRLSDGRLVDPDYVCGDPPP